VLANGRPLGPRAPIPDIMKRLTPAVQRIILAFTTGLFLACAAQVSAQSGGLSSAIQSVSP
jgi:hypothetical protein